MEAQEVSADLLLDPHQIARAERGHHLGVLVEGAHVAAEAGERGNAKCW